MQKKSLGYFQAGGSEYVVTEVETPLPFINYFWNESFISGVSQHMAGIGCFTERPIQYIHPVCRCLVVRDENRHFYLRDEDTGEIWSPGWYPVLECLDEFKCIHGLGYSRLESRKNDIRTGMRVFVPAREPVEIWTVSIKNEGKLKKQIKLYSFVDWLLKGYEEYCDYHSALHSVFNADKNLLMCFNEAPERPHNYFNGFISSNLKPSGFDSSRKAFIGFGQVDRPAAVLEGRCSNSLGTSEKLVGVLEHAFLLEPGEEVCLHILIGVADSVITAGKICADLYQGDRIEKEFEAVCKTIRIDYDRIRFTTPEEKLNSLFNYWIKRSIQMHAQVGTDTGKGFRDIMQATWALSGYDSEGARNKILECLEHQYSDGHTLRGWNPEDDHHYSDGPVWIAPAVDSYLKETRDFSFLNIEVPYYDTGKATVWEHVMKAIRCSTEDLGPHGLVRIRYGDWNDSLNMMGTGGNGESVWTSIAMVFSIRCAAEIAGKVLREEKTAGELFRRMEKLRTSIDNYGWDGEWYLEGYNDSGMKVGSKEEKEGRIYLNPQTWAIMAGIVGTARLEKILAAIDRELEDKCGSLVLTPAYTHPNPEIGRLTWFTPGMWENGSPYCHGTAFKIMADTYLKRGEAAYRSMMKILPDSEGNPSSYSGCPPYMVTNMYYGPGHPRAGQILYSWITGTSDWLFKAMAGNIIGVRPEYEGLLIDPCVPPHWKQFGIRREFLGSVYEIEFENPEGRQHAIKRIEVNGQPFEGNLIPLLPSGKLYKVRVLM